MKTTTKETITLSYLAKPVEGKICVEILRCKACGQMAVSIDDNRITGHKCAGAWDVIFAENIKAERILNLLE